MKTKIVLAAAMVCLSSCSTTSKLPFMCCVNINTHSVTCSQDVIPWDIISQPGVFCNVSPSAAEAEAAAVAASKASVVKK